MSIIRYEPWSLLTQMHNDLNTVLEGRNTSDNSRVATSQWIPAVDIKEDKQQFVIHADLPGVNLHDIEINMENGVLTLRGERHLENKIEQAGYSRVERSTGTFYRRFSLPDSVDQDAISAESKQGVLTIVIPKKERVKPRKIEVKSV